MDCTGTQVGGLKWKWGNMGDVSWGLWCTWLSGGDWAINNGVLPTTALRWDMGFLCAINIARGVIFAPF